MRNMNATRIVAKLGVQGAAQLWREIMQRVALVQEAEAAANGCGTRGEFGAAQKVAAIQGLCPSLAARCQVRSDD